MERIKAGLGDVFARVRTNASRIVFVAMTAVWLFLYFLRDEPIVILHRVVDDRIVLLVLSVLTIVFLLLTSAKLNILVALLIGAVLVLLHAARRSLHAARRRLHAARRKTDDLSEDEYANRQLLEEYIDYLFPEETQTTNLKILEAAYKWKKQKRSSDED